MQDVTKLIKLRDETYDRLLKHGKMKETFDSVITRLLDYYEGKESKKR
jgi:predicted CopG family antitoxin